MSQCQVALAHTLSSTEAAFSLPSPPTCSQSPRPTASGRMALRRCDTAGRVPGATVGTADEALAYLRDLERSNAGK